MFFRQRYELWYYKTMSRNALGITLVAMTLVLVPALVLAQGLQPVPGGFFSGIYGGGLINGIRTIVNVFLTLAGIAAVVIIIYGGAQYILARGEEDQARTAKNVILYAVIGLIIIGLSAAIVNFTIGAIWGTSAG